jgi:hypothetical protein
LPAGSIAKLTGAFPVAVAEPAAVNVPSELIVYEETVLSFVFAINIAFAEGATTTAEGNLPVVAAGLLELIVSCPVVKFIE